jgi:hypothetical protein
VLLIGFTFDFAEEFVCGFGPGEWFGAFVVAVDVGADRGFEVGDIGEGAAADRLAVMMPKKISTMFSHEQLVGVKCRVTRGFLSSQARMLGCLWAA